jgi:hypothetical protein
MPHLPAQGAAQHRARAQLWSYLACRIGFLVPVWQPCIGSPFTCTGSSAASRECSTRAPASCRRWSRCPPTAASTPKASRPRGTPLCSSSQMRCRALSACMSSATVYHLPLSSSSANRGPKARRSKTRRVFYPSASLSVQSCLAPFAGRGAAAGIRTGSGRSDGAHRRGGSARERL